MVKGPDGVSAPAVVAVIARAAANTNLRLTRLVNMQASTLLAAAQPNQLQLLREPDGNRTVEVTRHIDLAATYVVPGQDQKQADPIGEPNMRIGERRQLVLVVLDRLVVRGLAELDRHEIVRNLALVHDDVGKYRFCQVIVGRDDRAARQPQRAFTEPIVLTIDVPARKLPFEMNRQTMRQRALAAILVEQKGLAREKLGQRSNDL